MCSIHKHGDLFILTIIGNSDQHRLNPALIDSIRSALVQVRTEFMSQSTRPTSLIITAQGRFFSKGYDISWAHNNLARNIDMSKKFRLLVADLISFPIPTIAAVNGCASGAGLILALSHDYLLMRQDQGYLHLHEVEQIPNWYMAILKGKIASPKIRRNLVLGAWEINAATGVNWGIVDSAHEGEQGIVDAAVNLGMEVGIMEWQRAVYASNRRTMLSYVLAALRYDETVGDVPTRN